MIERERERESSPHDRTSHRPQKSPLIRMPLPIEALIQVVITRLQACQEEIRRLKRRLKRRRKEFIRLRDLEIRYNQLHEDYGILENEIIGLRSILQDNDIPYTVRHLV